VCESPLFSGNFIHYNDHFSEQHLFLQPANVCHALVMSNLTTLAINNTLKSLDKAIQSDDDMDVDDGNSNA
jgi:hypothetical protein